MSGASTLRNAVKRITHKERSQPSDRKKFGLLEKHKDYVERARDYHKKQDYLKVLRKKAADRNPDEFYFKMHNSQVQNGVHKDTTNESMDTELVKILKTQDMGYIVHKKAVDDRKIDKLKSNLHLIGDSKPSSHKIFVSEEADIDNFDCAKHFNTLPSMLDRTFNRPHVESLMDAAKHSSLSADIVKKAFKTRGKQYKELQNRTKRAAKLNAAMSELSAQRNVMGKGSKRKIVKTVGDEKKVQFKWKRQRSR